MRVLNADANGSNSGGRRRLVRCTGTVRPDRIADYLRDAGESADVFYLSNVERYLFDQGSVARFFANVEALPRSDHALFVRSVTTDISVRLGIPIPDGPERWRTFVMPIAPDLEDFADGRIREYRDLFDRP